MRTALFVVLVAAAFAAILLNALYGHLLYGSPHGQALSKYAVYVHLQPPWQSASANILYDVTVSWDGSPAESGAAPYNSNKVQSQRGRDLVLLQHGFSDCQVGWSPPLYRYGADLLRSHIGHMAGERLNADPYTPIFADVANTAHADSRQAALVKDGYVQFVPVCTDRDTTSFRYAISVDGREAAFDVHFVPAKQELHDYLAGDGSFEEYAGCGARNRHSHTGFCGDIGPDSGLLLVLPDNLQGSLIRVSVNLHEVTSSPDA